jgi:hypothetical protein
LLLPLMQKMALRAIVHHLTLGKWACGCPSPECWTLASEPNPGHAFSERMRDKEVAHAVTDRLWSHHCERNSGCNLPACRWDSILDLLCVASWCARLACYRCYSAGLPAAGFVLYMFTYAPLHARRSTCQE